MKSKLEQIKKIKTKMVSTSKTSVEDLFYVNLSTHDY